MKIKVTKRFIDNGTGELHEVGQEVSKSEVRAKHIIKRGFAIEIKEEKELKATKEEKTQYKTK